MKDTVLSFKPDDVDPGAYSRSCLPYLCVRIPFTGSVVRVDHKAFDCYSALCDISHDHVPLVATHDGARAFGLYLYFYLSNTFSAGQ